MSAAALTSQLQADAAPAELTVLTMQLKMPVSVTLATSFPTTSVCSIPSAPSTQPMTPTKVFASATLMANMSSMATAKLVPATLPGMELPASATQDLPNNPMASALPTVSMPLSMESPVSAGPDTSTSAEFADNATPTVSTAAPLKPASAMKDTTPPDPPHAPPVMAAAEPALDLPPTNA